MKVGTAVCNSILMFWERRLENLACLEGHSQDDEGFGKLIRQGVSGINTKRIGWLTIDTGQGVCKLPSNPQGALAHCSSPGRTDLGGVGRGHRKVKFIYEHPESAEDGRTTIKDMSPHQMRPVAEVTASLGKEEGLCAPGQEVKLGGLQDHFQLQDWQEDDPTISERSWVEMQQTPSWVSSVSAITSWSSAGAPDKPTPNMPPKHTDCFELKLLRNGQCKRVTMTLLSVSLKAGDKSLIWKVYSLHLARQGISDWEACVNKYCYFFNIPRPTFA